MRLAVAASALVASTGIAGPWHAIASSQDPTPRNTAALTRTAVQNIHQLGLRVSVAGHPHVFGTLTCTHGKKYDFDGWDYTAQVDAIHRLTIRVPLPAVCSFSATATVAGQPVPLTMVAYKR